MPQKGPAHLLGAFLPAQTDLQRVSAHSSLAGITQHSQGCVWQSIAAWLKP